MSVHASTAAPPSFYNSVVCKGVWGFNPLSLKLFFLTLVIIPLTSAARLEQFRQPTNHSNFDLFKNSGFTYCSLDYYPEYAHNLSLKEYDIEPYNGQWSRWSPIFPEPGTDWFFKNNVPKSQDDFCKYFDAPPIILPTKALRSSYFPTWVTSLIQFVSLSSTCLQLLFWVFKIDPAPPPLPPPPPGQQYSEETQENYHRVIRESGLHAKITSHYLVLSGVDFIRCLTWWVLLFWGVADLKNAEWTSTILWLMPFLHHNMLLEYVLDRQRQVKVLQDIMGDPSPLIAREMVEDEIRKQKKEYYFSDFTIWCAALVWLVLCVFMFGFSIGIIVVRWKNSVSTNNYAPLDFEYFSNEYSRICGGGRPLVLEDMMYLFTEPAVGGHRFLQTAQFVGVIAVLGTKHATKVCNQQQARLAAMRYMYMIMLAAGMVIPAIYQALMVWTRGNPAVGIGEMRSGAGICPPVAVVMMNGRFGYMDVKGELPWRIVKAIFGVGG